MVNYNKINLYKDNIIKFIQTQPNEIVNENKITDIDYLIGILFLTEMNRYCKINKISIHGYYIAYSLINLFIKIKKKLVKKEIITYKDINHFWISLANNIDYLNLRVADPNLLKNKINQNYCKFIMEIEQYITELVEYCQKHNEPDLNSSTSVKSTKSNKSNKSIKSIKSIISDKSNSINISNSLNTSDPSDSSISSNNLNELNSLDCIYCVNKCYVCWVDKVLRNFFYILLITAKFIGSGDIKDPNLLKMAEYYSNIFYTYIKIKDIGEKLDDKISFEFFDEYIEHKNKLNYSIIELKINSDTLEEILNFLDDFILKNLSKNN